jgi:hypothetical protein
MRCLPISKIIIARTQFDWPITQKKNETIKAPQNKRFYFEA